MVSWGESHKQSGNYATSVGKGERNVKIDDKIIGERAEKMRAHACFQEVKWNFLKLWTYAFFWEIKVFVSCKIQQMRKFTLKHWYVQFKSNSSEVLTYDFVLMVDSFSEDFCNSAFQFI